MIRFRKYLNRVRAPPRRLIKYDQKLKPICKKVLEFHRDYMAMWNFGNGAYNIDLQKLDYGKGVLVESVLSYYKNKYREFIVNKVVLHLDRFVIEEAGYLYGNIAKGNIVPAANGTYNVTFKPDSKIRSIVVGSNVNRMAFYKDHIKTSDNKPDLKNLSFCNGVVPFFCNTRTSKKFRIYPKCKSYMLTGDGNLNITGLVAKMKGELPDLYYGPYCNVNCFNGSESEEEQEVVIRFRLRMYVYVTFSKLFSYASEINKMDV